MISLLFHLIVGVVLGIILAIILIWAFGGIIRLLQIGLEKNMNMYKYKGVSDWYLNKDSNTIISPSLGMYEVVNGLSEMKAIGKEINFNKKEHKI